MAWSDLIDQRRVADALQGAIARGRVAHAYLFYGPDGVGKRALALEFAKTLQCERAEDTACGACGPCRKVARLIHPDVQVLLPQPNDADEHEVAARLARLAEEPYAAVDFLRRPALDDPTKTSNKQAIYTVGRINDALRRSMSFRPVEGRYKIVLMTDADLLRNEAANAFLKLLEEPPAQTVFVLTTTRLDRLLPTIVSRCQRFRFAPLAAEAIAQGLVRRAGLEAGYAETLARMADGSYARALDLSESDSLREDREEVVRFVRHAYAGRIDPLADQVEALQRLGRERLKGVLRLLLRWVRDLMLFRTLGAEAPLVNVDQRETIESFCAGVPDADLGAMVAQVEEAIELVERNVQAALVLIPLAGGLRAAMHGRGAERLYVPLADG